MYSEKSDLYAVGVIFWELSSRKVPYEGLPPARMMMKTLAGNRDKIPEATPPKFATLIAKLWARRVEDRPTSASEVFDELSLPDADIPVAYGAGAGR